MCTVCGHTGDAPPCAAGDGGTISGPDGALEDAANIDGGRCTCDVRSYNEFAVYQPLACGCGANGAIGALRDFGVADADCARSLAEQTAARCAAGETVTLAKGCGKVEVLGPLGSGTSLIFSEASGRLIGIYAYGDIGFGLCSSSYVFGEGLFEHDTPLASPHSGCATLDDCTLCGDPSLFPRCAP
jgi:hypothetical protein